MAKHFDLALRLPYPTDEDLKKILGVSTPRPEPPKNQAGDTVKNSSAVEQQSSGHAPSTTDRADGPEPDRERMAPLSQAVDEAESLDSDMTDPDAGPSVEEATKEIEGYLLGLHIGSAGRNARVVRRARNHYWFLRGTFPDLPQERLAEACLAVSENLSLVEYPVGRGPVPGHDTDLLCDALGVTTPPETQSKATDTGEG